MQTTRNQDQDVVYSAQQSLERLHSFKNKGNDNFKAGLYPEALRSYYSGILEAKLILKESGSSNPMVESVKS